MYDKKRIGVFGAGAIGGVVGGLLSRAGHDVTLIDTWFEHVEQINKNGLIVTNQESSYRCKPKAVNINKLQEIKEKFDIGIISVKSYDTEWATHALKNHVKENGFFVDFQNGINDLRIAEIVGKTATVYVNLDHKFHSKLYKSLAEELDKTNIEIVDFMLMSWARVEDELVASNVELDTFVKIKEKWGQILTELLDEQDRMIN